MDEYLGWIPNKAREAFDTNPSARREISNAVFMKKRYMINLFSKIGLPSKEVKRVYDVAKGPLGDLINLLDEHNVRKTAEEAAAYYAKDRILMKWDLLPDGYKSRVDEFFPLTDAETYARMREEEMEMIRKEKKEKEEQEEREKEQRKKDWEEFYKEKERIAREMEEIRLKKSGDVGIPPKKQEEPSQSESDSDADTKVSEQEAVADEKIKRDIEIAIKSNREMHRRAAENKIIREMATDTVVNSNKNVKQPCTNTRDSKRKQEYYKQVPDACDCDVCAEWVHPEDHPPQEIEPEEGDNLLMRLGKQAAKDAHDHRIEETNKLSMSMMKKVNVSKWYNLISNREMRLDIYKLFMIREKNWGQKDVLANYYESAGAYLRQVYLECQILVKEFGDQVRKDIPENFHWIKLKPTLPNKPAQTNMTLDKDYIPRGHVDVQEWSKKKAANNRDVPLDDIMNGKYDKEAGEIWDDDPYFMDPVKLYERGFYIHQMWWSPGEAGMSFRRAARRMDYRRFESVSFRWFEKRIPFKEFEGDLNKIGSDFQRFRLVFKRPNKASPSKKKKTKPTAKGLYSKAMVMGEYDEENVRSIGDLPDLKLAYTDLSTTLDFDNDFPVKEIGCDEYWSKYHATGTGPNDYRHPIMYYKEKQPGGKIKESYQVNRTTLKQMIRKEDKYKKDHDKVGWYFDIISTYRRERVEWRVYDDMERLFGINHVDKKYHLTKDRTIEDVIYKEFLDEYKSHGGRGKMSCKYLDKIVKGSLKNMKMLNRCSDKNPVVVHECYNYYSLVNKQIMKDLESKWAANLNDDDIWGLNCMFRQCDALNTKRKAFEREIKDPADIMVRKYLNNLRSKKNRFFSVMDYPND
ncbi:hypothetical protein LPJ74_005493 [Coemansia sp. RSA 1843]|nr:hypothetical protein LPJ74_005493 [Coemansia sp. RSA 1843]